MIKINTEDDGFLIFTTITNSVHSSKYRYCVLRTDSNGIVKAIENIPEIRYNVRADKLYGPDEGEGACLVTTDYNYYFNKEGKIVNQTPSHGVVTYGIRNMPLDTLGFFDSTETLLWKNNFERAKIVIKHEHGREYVHKHFWHIGYNQTYQGKLLIYDKYITDEDVISGNYKHGYILIHINKEGWPIGYDPDNLPPDSDTLEPIPKEIGFTQSGDLRLPASFSGLQLRVSDMAGKTLYKGEVPPDGMVSMPPLATGIYVVQCHNPQTGEKVNRKVFKG